LKGSDNDLIKYSCPDVKCETTCEIGESSACTSYIDRVVANVGASGISIVCDPSTNSCQVVEETLNMFFNDVNIGHCRTGTCVYNNNSVRADLDTFKDDKIEINNAQITTYTLSSLMLATITFVFLGIIGFVYTMRNFSSPSLKTCDY